MEEQRPIARALETFRIVWFRLWGMAAIVLSSFGMLISVPTFIVAVVAPIERATKLGEGLAGVLFCSLFLYLGIRAVRVSKQELRDAPKQLARRRDQLEAWINKPRRREDV